MNRLGDFLNRIASVFTAAAGIAMTIIVVLQVIMRYVFNDSIFGSDEIARLLLIWIAFIGGSVAFKELKLANIGIILDRLKGRVLAAVLLIGYVLIFIFLVIAVWKGFSLVTAQMKQLSPSLRLPMGLMYLGVPIGLALMTYYDLLFIIDKIRELLGVSASVTD